MRFENEPAMPLQRAAEIPARSSEEQRAIAAVLRCYFAALVGKSERFRGAATPAGAFFRFYQREQRRARWRHEEILPSAQDRLTCPQHPLPFAGTTVAFTPSGCTPS